MAQCIVNRKVLSFPNSEWQTKLETTSKEFFLRDKAKVLDDSLLLHKNWLEQPASIKERFLKFKEKEASITKHYWSSSNSLFWQCANIENNSTHRV